MVMLGGGVVGVDDGGARRRAAKFGEELPEPRCLGDGAGDAPVLSLRARAGDSGLALRGPADEVGAEVHRKAGRRLAGVRTPPPSRRPSKPLGRCWRSGRSAAQGGLPHVHTEESSSPSGSGRPWDHA